MKSEIKEGSSLEQKKEGTESEIEKGYSKQLDSNKKEKQMDDSAKIPKMEILNQEEFNAEMNMNETDENFEVEFENEKDLFEMKIPKRFSRKL